MDKNKSLLIGVGQAGGNIVSEILKKDKRYIGLFINSSYKDLMSIENAKNIYVIPNADGTGRNREVAKDYGREYCYTIIDQIDKFPLQTDLWFFFSLGGGTGSGLSPSVIKLINKLRPNKQINIVAISPSFTESKKAKENAKECWNELIAIDSISMRHLLDNNKRENKKDINLDFAKKFDAMMNISNPNTNGEETIDNGDAKVVTSAKGSAAIYFLPEESDTKIALAKGISDSIYADFSNGEFEYMAISLRHDSKLDRKTIVNYFTPTEDKFIYGHNDKYNVVIVTGASMGLQKELIELLDVSIAENSVVKKDDSIEDLIVGDTSAIKSNHKVQDSTHLSNIKQQETKIDDILDDDEFWKDIF